MDNSEQFVVINVGKNKAVGGYDQRHDFFEQTNRVKCTLSALTAADPLGVTVATAGSGHVIHATQAKALTCQSNTPEDQSKDFSQRLMTTD